MDNRRLIDLASKNEWTLECDRKVLDMMQNLASKIESRASTTNSKMNNMILSLDETKIKMSNLTRINDIKNTVYCENLITDDHLEPISEVPKNTVKLSKNIAIQNGLKLMENCFEKHRVNLDPSSSRTEITTVYRPIDKFYTPLPYLIGEKNWKEKWHLGLIEEDKFSQTGSVYAESVESNVTPNSRLESDNLLASDTNLMASQTSLTKSTSSIGDQMIINKQGGLFDEVYSNEQVTPTIKQPSTSSFFPSQPPERKIVNLFDDEPPELTVESSHDRKAVNLFDDIDSVASMPINEPESFDRPLPPVDLFDDSEFDTFIRKMETDQHKNQTEIPKKHETMKEDNKINTSMQANMKNIADEIKNVQLRKKENVSGASSTVSKTVQAKQPDKKVAEKPESSKNDNLERNLQTSKTEQRKSQEVSVNSVVTKSRPKITNLFDDDDTEDFFQEIIKQKSQNNESKLSQIKQEEPRLQKQAVERRTINLFDDEDDDGEFDSIFNKKMTSSVTVSSSKPDKNLFDIKIKPETKKSELIPSTSYESQESQKNNTIISDNKTQMVDKTSVRHKKLFDESDEESEKSLIQPKMESRETSQDSEKINIKEEEEDSGQIRRSASSTIMTDDLSNSVDDAPSDNSIRIGSKHLNNQIEDNISQSSIENNKGDLTSTSDKLIIANCPNTDNANNEVPNVINKPENEDINVNNQNVEREAKTDIFEPSISSRTSQPKDFGNPILFLSDEPPDDDDMWDTEENNFEEQDVRENVSRSNSNYLAFNDTPPDDDFTDQNISDSTDKNIESIEVEKTGAENVSSMDKSIDIESKDKLKNLFEDEDSYHKPLKKEEISPQAMNKSEDQMASQSQVPSPSKNIFNEQKNDALSEPQSVASKVEVKSNVKSKLDIFSKTVERQVSQQPESPPKKLPGKLNMNLKINVGALMPGARIPRRQQSQSEDSNNESFDRTPSIEEPDSFSSPDKSLSYTEMSSSTTEKSSSSGLLNNDITKLRTKIQVKRRPSTRKGRRSIYEQTLNDNIEEESKESQEKSEFDSSSTSASEIKQLDNDSTSDITQSSLSSQEFYKSTVHTTVIEVNEVDQTQNIMQSEVIPQPNKQDSKEHIPKLFDNEEPPPIDEIFEPKTAITSTSKTRVFYDDEDETRQMLEDEKKKKANEKPALWLFDNNDEDQPENFTSKSTPKVKLESSVSKSSSLFDDNSDNDLFPASKKEDEKKAETVAPKKSLFNDDDDDDELFSPVKKKVSQKSATKLFEDDDDKLGSSIIFSKPSSSTKPKKQSIFGDEDLDDDDDLFSSKPKSAVPSNSASQASSRTVVKKTTSTVVNDPLKDLLDD